MQAKITKRELKLLSQSTSHGPDLRVAVTIYESKKNRYLLQQQRDGVDVWCIPTPQISVGQIREFTKDPHGIKEYICFK